MSITVSDLNVFCFQNILSYLNIQEKQTLAKVNTLFSTIINKLSFEEYSSSFKKRRLSSFEPVKTYEDLMKEEFLLIQELDKNFIDLNVNDLQIVELSNYIRGYNLLQFWKKLPGGSERLENFDAQKLSFMDKINQFVHWLGNNQNILNLDLINLSSAKLTKVPTEIVFFRNLKSLILADNYLKEFPSFLEDSKLEVLDLSNNQIEKIEEFYLPNLKRLYLSKNKLKKFPDNLEDMPLSRLDLSDNRLKKFPNISHLPIEKLDISKNILKELPESLPFQLKVFDASNNQIEKIPETFQNFLLEKLYLMNNKISEIENITNSSLKMLDLSGNKIRKISCEFKPEGLKHLILSNNPLEEKPNEYNFPSLKEMECYTDKFHVDIRF